MNKRFKKVISSVLAAVMTLGVVSVTNVSSVFAEQTEQPWMATDSTPDWLSFSSEGWSTTTTNTTSGYKAVFRETIFGDESTGTTGSVKGQTNYKSSDNTATLTVTSFGSNAELKLYALRDSSSGTYIKSINTTDYSADDYPLGYTKQDSSTIDPVTISLETAGEYTIKFNSSGVSVYKITLKDELPSKGIVTINSTENGITTVESVKDGKKINDGDEVAGGTKLTISAVPNNDDTKEYIANISVKNADGQDITLNNNSFYVNGNVTINVEYTEDTSSRIRDSFNINFEEGFTKTKISDNLYDLGNGVYALDDFTYASLKSETSSSANPIEMANFESGRTRVGYVQNTSNNPADANNKTGLNSTSVPVKGSALKFVARATGTLYVDYRAGVTGTSRAVYVVGVDAAGTPKSVAKDDDAGELKTVSFKIESGNEYYVFGVSTKAKFYGVTFVKENEDPITKGASTTNASVYASNGSYYAIAVVKATDVETASKVVFVNGNTEIEDTESNTVYSSVKIGDDIYNAAAFGGDTTDYVYAVKVTGTGDDTASNIINNINAATVSLGN